MQTSMQPYLNFSIPSYSLFSIIGLFCMMVIIYLRSENSCMSFNNLLLLYVLLVCGAGLGSKLLFILTKVPEILEVHTWRHTIHVIITSGFVFYGGLSGALLSVLLFSRVQKMPFLVLTNIVTPGFIVFHIWGRIGCFFAGCCYGITVPWGIPLYSEPNIPRLPVQLLESAGIFIILCILLVYEHKKSKKQIS